MSWKILEVLWEVKESNFICSRRCSEPNPFPLTSATKLVPPAASPISTTGYHHVFGSSLNHSLSFPSVASSHKAQQILLP